MNIFERSLLRRIEREVPDLANITPGLVIEVHQRGRRKGRIELGDTYEFYDLASLTKVIFTASYSMRVFSSQPKALQQPIGEFLPDWKCAKRSPQQFLTHTAGMDWWRPYYKSLKGPMFPDSRWSQLKRKLKKIKPVRQQKAIYSDLDLWAMGAYLEASQEKSLLSMWEHLHERLDLGEIFFHPGNRPRYARSRYAPTELCSWRGKVMQGEVHDENTWALAGVAPHSGLFGTIEAVSDWGLKLRAAVLKDSEAFGSPKMVKNFVQRQIPRVVGDWGLGFMKPSLPKSSCGRHFSVKSFGHTGFTGTSVWIDPVKDLMVVILSNRVHPTRDNKQFVSLRGPLHDWVVESL